MKKAILVFVLALLGCVLVFKVVSIETATAVQLEERCISSNDCVDLVPGELFMTDFQDEEGMRCCCQASQYSRGHRAVY